MSMAEKMKPGSDREMMEKLMKMRGESEEEIREYVDAFWGVIQQIEDPLTHDFWMLIDQPWRHPTLEEMAHHVGYAYWLCDLVAVEAIKLTGHRWIKRPGLSTVFEMLTAHKKPNKVVRGAMQAALYIREEQQKGQE